MEKKNKAAYLSLFSLIKQLFLEMGCCLKVSCIAKDFELAFSIALKNIFPSCSISYCMFHLSQAFIHWIAVNGFQVQFRNDENFKQEIRLLVALAYLPHNLIEEGFNVTYETFSDDAKEIADHFNNTYIGYCTSVKPNFETSEWSCYERVLNDQPTTSNFLEGYNNRLKILVGKKTTRIL